MDQYRKISMRLFAAWDVDRTSTNCVPRLCNMTLTRLTVFKPLEPDCALNSMVIAVKLQGYKRTLRSNDVNVSINNGIIDVDLDISFTLQYPHFVKKKSNCLLIMLQRRKKYKTRQIPGFKTLAVGSVNLTQVLQSMPIRELALYSDTDKSTPAAKLYLVNLVTQPLEQDDLKIKEQSGDYSDDEEDESTPNEDGGSDSELMVDEHGVPVPNSSGGANSSMFSSRQQSNNNNKFKFSSTTPRFISQRTNLKQKFVALLKKLKLPEQEATEADESEGNDRKPTQQEIEALFEELENLSDSGPEGDADTLSVKSTPKPVLPPYFNSSTSLGGIGVDSFGGGENISEESKESADSQTGDLDTTDPEGSDVPFGIPKMSTPRSPPKKEAKPSTYPNQASTPPSKDPVRQSTTVPFHTSAEKKKYLRNWKNSASVDVGGVSADKNSYGKFGHVGTSSTKLVPKPVVKEAPLIHKPVGEQLTHLMPAEENFIPECILLVGASDVHCQSFVNGLRDKYQKLFVLTSQNDVKCFFVALLTRIQRFCNMNSTHPQSVKLAIVGGDRFLSNCLKCYVDTFAPKPNDWLHFVRFFVVAPSWSTVGRCLSTLDHNYSTLFGDSFWRDWWDRGELNESESNDLTARISKYLTSAKANASLPIAEAMLHLKDKGANDEVSQIFVPFVVDVRLGGGESSSIDIPLDSPGGGSGQPLSSSPPNTTPTGAKSTDGGQHSSPPGSPHTHERDKSMIPVFTAGLNEAQDLQLEYWLTQAASSSAAPLGGGPSPNVFRSDSTSQKKEKEKDASGGSVPAKGSLKTAFRSLTINRVPANSTCLLTAVGETPQTSSSLNVQFVREKKKDKMLQKLGMKNKEKIESELKKQSVDNVSRMICSTKQHTTMKLFIDGVEWTNVKFFQISAQWQTHVKYVCVALFAIDVS